MSAPAVLTRSADAANEAPRQLAIAGHTFDLLGPSVRDPRLALAATIIGLQVLGQTALGFDVSIAQILIAIGTAAALELFIVAWQRRQIAWPASAMQTGSGVAIILRVPGTEHGDWWSTRGWSLFMGVAAFSVFSKYAIRWGDRHLFNPANLGLVAAFVLLGESWVDPQDLWWGPLSPAILATLVVIAFGGVFATYRAGVLPVAASFFVPFAALLAVLAASGHSMTARWSAQPITDWHYWWILVTSPEILVFVLFMITDPRTVPKGATARVGFGMAIAVAAVLMIAPVRTEYWTKVNILAALAICCALRPAFERWIPTDAPPPSELWRRCTRSPRLLAGVAAVALLVAAAVVGLGTPARAATTSSTVNPTVDGRRPDVVTPAVPIRLGTSPDIAGTVDATTARTAATDVLENIAIEAEALRTEDSEMAATALFGERLTQIQNAISAGEAVDVTTVEPEHITVLWIRGSSGPQAPPQLGVTIWGSAITDRFDKGEVVGTPTTSKFARTFIVVDAGDVFLTVGDSEPIGNHNGPAI